MVKSGEQYKGSEFIRDVAVVALIGSIALIGIEAI